MLNKKIFKMLAVSLVVVVLISSNRAFAEESTGEDDVIIEEEETVDDAAEEEQADESIGESEQADESLEEENNIETFTVSFIDTVDDAVFESFEVKSGESVETLPTAPEHEGYSFKCYEGNYKDVNKNEEVKAIYEKTGVETEDNEINAEVAKHKIIIKGKMPKDTEIVVKEISDYEAVTNLVSKSLPSKMGFYEITSFDIEFSYMEEGEKKKFVPADLGETYDVTVMNTGRSENISAYSLGDDCKSLGASGTSEATFSVSDESSVTVGVTYGCNSAICGRAPMGAANKKISALGSRVQYTTKSDSRGNYLITGVDYSKAHAGCCFEIVLK